MINPLRRTLLAFSGLLVLAALPARGQDLPEADAILARYHEAVGGRDVLDRYTSMHAVGEFSMPAQGLVGSLVLYSARPNRAAMTVSIAGFGEMRTGYTGEVGWSLNPMEGPRLLEGPELSQTAEESAFDHALRLPAHIRSATTVERTKLAGRDCIKVRIEWQSGREMQDCFSEETGLLVGTVATQHSNMGALETVSLYDDYRDFGGMKMAGRMTIQVMGMEQVVTIHTVTFDDVPDSAFEPPAAIRSLIGG